MKEHRLKEPTLEEAEISVKKIITLTAELVLADHRGDVGRAEKVMLTECYLQRAVDTVKDKKFKI